jgi:hypothetical protein
LVALADGTHYVHIWLNTDFGVLPGVDYTLTITVDP